MGRINVVISDELEIQLRRASMKKGDLGRIVDKALREYFEREDAPK